MRSLTLEVVRGDVLCLISHCKERLRQQRLEGLLQQCLKIDASCCSSNSQGGAHCMWEAWPAPRTLCT